MHVSMRIRMYIIYTSMVMKHGTKEGESAMNRLASPAAWGVVVLDCHLSVLA